MRLGKWPEVAAFRPRLIDVAKLQGVEFTRLDPDLCLQAGALAWDHRDPFDRMIAATALAYDMPLASSDKVVDELVQRIW